MSTMRFSKDFWIISFALFFFMVSFNIILPELNDFITNLGGEDKKGLIISLYAISAAISRPFSGKLSDTIGRKKVMMIGMLVAALMSILYPLTGLITFLLLRFLHGFAAGFLPTGATALVTDILPAEKRGMGMGIWGTFSSVGIGFGQIFAASIVDNFGLNGLFLLSSILAIISGFMVMTVSESLEKPQAFKTEFLKVSWNDVFEPTVMPAAVVMFCQAISSGIVFAVTADISGYLDIENKGWFFGFYMVSTICIRVFSGGLSDKIGRRASLVIGLSFMVLAMTMIGFSTSVGMYSAGSVIFGIATGISSPTLFAWTADLSPSNRRGVGAGTLFIALETGIMIGSFSLFLTYNNSFSSIPTVFLFGASFSLIAIFYLLWHIKTRSEK